MAAFYSAKRVENCMRRLFSILMLKRAAPRRCRCNKKPSFYCNLVLKLSFSATERLKTRCSGVQSLLSAQK